MSEYLHLLKHQLRIKNEQKLAELRAKNNPHNEKTGPFTGRCEHCGSSDLWETPYGYGCTCCGTLLHQGDLLPVLAFGETAIDKSGYAYTPIFLINPKTGKPV